MPCSSITMYWLNMSLFFAFATLWPEQRVLLFFFIPVKMKWLAWVDAAYFAFTIIRYLVNGYVWLALVPVVAMAAYMLFCGEWLIDLLRPSHAREVAARKARTIQFKSAVRRIEREREKQPYSRKCAAEPTPITRSWSSAFAAAARAITASAGITSTTISILPSESYHRIHPAPCKPYTV